jgi:hypothetical protein
MLSGKMTVLVGDTPCCVLDGETLLLEIANHNENINSKELSKNGNYIS